MLSYEEFVKNVNILLVDDDENYITISKIYLNKMGYNVDICTNGSEAIAAVKTNKYQILLIDYYMPILNGEEVISEIRKYNNDIIIILQTGFSGQKPPVEMLKTLNIQNYHDKTEGMERLNLQIIAAIKTFSQQNEIAISKYRVNAIGSVITSVAANLKASLLNISGSMEITNMLLKNEGMLEKSEELNELYKENKKNLEKVDKVLTVLINEIEKDSNTMVTGLEIVDIIKIMLASQVRINSYELVAESRLRTNNYLFGNITDIIFLVCEIILNLIKNNSEDKKINFVLTENEEFWYFKIVNNGIKEILNKDKFLYKNIAISLKNTNINFEEDNINITLKKD